jgi:hypothetical protein
MDAAVQEQQKAASTGSILQAGAVEALPQLNSAPTLSCPQLPPTHKPLTHNPPSSPTMAPWPSPATGSPFPQLARPSDNAIGVISSSAKADRMSPTAAPWVAAPAAGPPSSQLMTGRPVQGAQCRYDAICTVDTVEVGKGGCVVPLAAHNCTCMPLFG